MKRFWRANYKSEDCASPGSSRYLLCTKGLALKWDFAPIWWYVVEDKVTIEIKSITEIAALHKKRLLTYLRLADKRLSLLINFNVAMIKDGITRIVNGLEE
jgi:hypothetical protein